jgi:hypothetical protein
MCRTIDDGVNVALITRRSCVGALSEGAFGIRQKEEKENSKTRPLHNNVPKTGALVF